MKKLFSLGLIAGFIVSMMFSGSAPRADAQTAGMVSSALSRLQRSTQSLTSLRATINMRKYNSQLREEESYSGFLKYVPVRGGNAFLYLEWKEPHREFLVSTNGNYQLYRPRLNIVYEGKNVKIGKGDNEVLQLITMSSAQLRARFGEFQDPYEETLGGGVSTTHFKAIPKGQASYKHIEFWIDNKEGMPVQTKMVEKNDDATTIRLSNLEKNQNISPGEFKLSLPANVKHVRG